MDQPAGPSALPGDRGVLLTRGRALLPLTLVLVSLLSLALIPVITMRKTGAVRSHIATVAEPARAHVTVIQNSIALESAAVRGFLLTGDPEVAAHHLSARESRYRAVAGLEALDNRLSPEVQAATATLVFQLRRTEPTLDSLFGGSLARRVLLDRLARQQDALQGVLAAATDLDAAIADDVTGSLGRVRTYEAVGAALTIAMVALALVAAALVARLARNLRESEERFRQIAEGIHDFVSLSDRDFTRHLFLNSAYERIWGRPREELYANPLALLDGVHPDDRERVRAAIDKLRHGAYDIEFRVVRPDGEPRWVWSRGFPVLNARGEIYRVAGITEDITERRQAAESHARLIRGFTHDVKNPLGAADGFLALLEDGVLGEISPKQAESVGRSRRSIRAALDLTAQLLEIARAEAGQLVIERGPVHLDGAAREIVEEFRAEAEGKQLSLALHLPPDGTRVLVESDRARVRQILANLVSNAVKYNRERGSITVTVRVADEGEGPTPGTWAAVAVSDTGNGIPAEKQRMLFREFTRLNPGAAEGSGIGLAISQRVAHALDGSITVNSTPGSGSTFTLWLPVGTPKSARG